MNFFGGLTPVALRAPSVSPPKPELSTLLRTGTFYFALTAQANSRPTTDKGQLTLQNNPRISFAAGDMLAVQVFEQGNGVLAAEAGDFLKGRNVEAITPGLVLDH